VVRGGAGIGVGGLVRVVGIGEGIVGRIVVHAGRVGAAGGVGAVTVAVRVETLPEAAAGSRGGAVRGAELREEGSPSGGVLKGGAEIARVRGVVEKNFTNARGAGYKRETGRVGSCELAVHGEVGASPKFSDELVSV